MADVGCGYGTAAGATVAGSDLSRRPSTPARRCGISWGSQERDEFHHEFRNQNQAYASAH